MYLFVYGSLLTGLSNHKILQYGNAKFISSYETHEKYYMVGLKSGAYPYVIDEPVHPTCQATTIRGELYEISEHLLAKLDAFEGHPHHYTRQLIAVHNGNVFEPVMAYTYMITNEYMKTEIAAAFDQRFANVTGGDWKRFIPMQ